ncbi:DMT family transporter [Fangia hongkongensis]|uniref:DMT family transporter n=2 Tax=Fangia hongkongensis TaxID=270495 RepID=UPI0003714C77|nr:DMT family transporter [Fangia hongkongensis]
MMMEKVYKKMPVKLGIIIGVLSGMLWGLNDVFTNIYSQKVLISSQSLFVIVFALSLSFMQDSFSCAGILSYHRAKNTFAKNWQAPKKIYILLAIAAICAGPLGMVAGVVGIAYAGPVYAGVVTSCYPVVALILATLFLRERPTKLKLIGVVLSVTAVIFISIAGEKSGIENITIGLIFAGCAMLGWGMESVLFSYVSHRSSCDTSWLLAVRQFCSAVSYLLILIVIAIFYLPILLTVWDSIFHPLLIVACVLSAATSYLAYYHAIKQIGASLGTTFNASFIFWAGIFSVLFQISQLHLSFILWGCVLIIGIYCATSGTVRPKKVLI